MLCDRENINNRKTFILYCVIERIFITEKLLYYILC